jgi:hypothetical protein
VSPVFSYRRDIFKENEWKVLRIMDLINSRSKALPWNALKVVLPLPLRRQSHFEGIPTWNMGTRGLLGMTGFQKMDQAVRIASLRKLLKLFLQDS